MASKPQIFTLPEGHSQLLLHSCCAPCSGGIIESLQEANIPLTIFFYNPNIHPQKEYLLRKDENKNYAAKKGIPFVDADYDPKEWFARTKHLKWAPERGERCALCFGMRLQKAAAYAHTHGFTLFTTTLASSRWKNLEQINHEGKMAASRYPNLTYWDFNWRKGGRTQRKLEIAKEEGFYQQEYCGCSYSLRDSNKHRLANGKKRIQIGVKFYGKKDEDNASS